MATSNTAIPNDAPSLRSAGGEGERHRQLTMYVAGAPAKALTAMLAPYRNRNRGDSRAVLVAYSISPVMRSVCEKYGVHSVAVSERLVREWHAARDLSPESPSVVPSESDTANTESPFVVQIQ